MMTSDEPTRQEWRELGFYYEFEEATARWRLVGSREGLRGFCSLLRTYAADARNTRLSEHEHYGPYQYLKIVTWHEAAITPDTITGTLADFLRLANIVERHLRTTMDGNTFCVEVEYAQNSPVALCFEVRPPGFDPASTDPKLVACG